MNWRPTSRDSGDLRAEFIDGPLHVRLHAFADGRAEVIWSHIDAPHRKHRHTAQLRDLRDARAHCEDVATVLATEDELALPHLPFAVQDEFGDDLAEALAARDEPDGLSREEIWVALCRAVGLPPAETVEAAWLRVAIDVFCTSAWLKIRAEEEESARNQGEITD